MRDVEAFLIGSTWRNRIQADIVIDITISSCEICDMFTKRYFYSQSDIPKKFNSSRVTQYIIDESLDTLMTHHFATVSFEGEPPLSSKRQRDEVAG